MFSMSRVLAAALCLAVVLGAGSSAFAQVAGTGVDTNQLNLPFSIKGTTYMTLTAGAVTFPTNTTVGASGTLGLTSTGVLSLQSAAGTGIYVGTTPYLFVASNGNVGINMGATAPAYDLQVNGVLGITGTKAALSVAGGVTATNLTLGTAPAITSATAQTLANLASVGVCNTAATGTTASALAITASSGGILSFSCETIADITGVGKTTLPTCSASQVLTFNGTSFSCVANPAVPNCPAGDVLTSDGTNFSCVSNLTPNCGSGYVLTSNGTSFSCVPNPAAPNCNTGQVVTSMDGKTFSCVTASCTAGTLYQGLNSSGVPICVAFPNCGADQLYGTDDNGNTVCLDAPNTNPNTGVPLYVKPTLITSSGAYNNYLWKGLGGTGTYTGGSATPANIAKLSTTSQGFWATCKISSNSDGNINVNATGASGANGIMNCNFALCAGTTGYPIMTQVNGVCNASQGGPGTGLPCTPPGGKDSNGNVLVNGSMYYSLNCMYMD